MAGYIDVPWEGDDPDDAIQRAFDYLMANVPLWTPADGHLETWLIEAMGRMVYEAQVVAALVPTSIFRYFGRSILGLAPVEPAYATAASTWTLVDTQGYTITEGTLVAWRIAGDQLIAFRVTEDVVVPPGQDVTPANAVLLEALIPGDEANGLAAGAIELVDALAFVETITATTTAGGVDAESDEDYLDRLAEELRLQSPRPILPNDFAVLARRVAGIHRALAIDGYNPVGGTFNNERMITLVSVDEDGADIDAPTKAELSAYMESLREVNFVVNTAAPTYTAIDTVVTVKAAAGYDHADLDARVTAALTEYYDPGLWGGGGDSPPYWDADADTVRYLEVAELINRVEGVAYIVAGTFTVEGATADVALAGVAPLPTPGTITVTVT